MNELYAQIFSRKFVSALSAHRTGNSCTCTEFHLYSCSNLDLLTDSFDVDREQTLTGHFVEECHQDFQNPLELQIRILGTKRPGVIVHPEEKLLAILLVEAHLIRILGEMMTNLRLEIDPLKTHTPHQ